MHFPTQFICAAEDYTTFTHHVPAPYLRRSFHVARPTTAHLVIGALGFYELYLNGRRYTKGALAPYISNPDDIVYYDCYELPLKAGENVLGVLLGNGLQNNPGGYIWDFDKATFRSAPCVALELTYVCGGKEHRIISDTDFLTAPSPIVFDDYRFGEHYDARRELSGWAQPGFDDSAWSPAQLAPAPKGEPRLCTAEPIVVTKTLRPVEIVREGEGYRYDFGQNLAGVCRMTVRNTTPGQKIELLHGEYLLNGVLDVRNIWFVRDYWERDRELVHKDIYFCAGGEEESYTPTFTYHGFRYVTVTGITEEQATSDLLTYLVMNSDLEERGGFTCSDETANTLQELTRRSDLSNFYYFPTDCPHREKNGWSADAALSAEHMLLNLNPENSYREWMHNIVKAQDDRGALPGIIPTGGWGFQWGNGPGWDSVLIYLPYFVYRYRGDLRMAEESADAMLRYLKYLENAADGRGLIHIGLGDWCQLGRDEWEYATPLEFTDSVISMDLANKAALLFERMGKDQERRFCERFARSLRTAVRALLIDSDACLAAGDCQTAQAMGLFYGVFEPNERQRAFEQLLRQIDRANGHMDTGVLGGRVIFHVLTEFGRSDLAFQMIVRPDFPSYGNWVARGATSLWEDFREEGDKVNSQNHHFWGDISSWFIQSLAGIRLNPRCRDVNEAEIRPCFIPQLANASGFHIAPAGKISVSWERTAEEVWLTLTVPPKMTGCIRLEPGWRFEDGSAEHPAVSGRYRVTKAD